MNIAQFLFAYLRVTLIDAILRTPVGQEVLGRCDYIGTGEQVLIVRTALEPANHRTDIGRDKLRVGGIAFVRPSPTPVPRNRDGRGEGPLLSCDADFFRRRASDTLDQRDIVCCAEPHVVGENRCSDDIRVTVNSVDAPDRGDTDTTVRRVDRSIVKCVRGCQPFRRRGKVIAPRAAVPAHQNRAKVVGFDVLRRHAAQIGLDQLTDLFFQRHALEQRIDPRLVLGRGCGRVAVARPDRRVCNAFLRRGHRRWTIIGRDNGRAR